MRPPVATVRPSPDKEEEGGQRMTAARIIEAVGSLLWPLLVAVLLIRILPHVPGVVADLRRALRTRAFTVKVAGAELTMEEATEQLRRQVADLQTHMAIQLAERDDAAPVPPPAPPSAAGAGEAEAAGPPAPGRPTLLWVDDHPDDHALELAKLRDDGIEVLLARSTAEALDVLSLRRGVQAVVTDLARSEDGEFRAHAGLALLRQLKEAEHDQPVLVYTEAARAELDRRDALDAGAALVTASPVELLAALQRVLVAPAAARPDGPGAAGTPSQGEQRRPRRPIRPG
jgi:CheY-like chemotaxis protein